MMGVKCWDDSDGVVVKLRRAATMLSRRVGVEVMEGGSVVLELEKTRETSKGVENLTASYARATLVPRTRKAAGIVKLGILQCKK